METLPNGWTVHTWEQKGQHGTKLLKRGSADKTSTHVHDLFHEDAQVFVFSDRFLWIFHIKASCCSVYIYIYIHKSNCR